MDPPVIAPSANDSPGDGTTKAAAPGDQPQDMEIDTQSHEQEKPSPTAQSEVQEVSCGPSDSFDMEDALLAMAAGVQSAKLAKNEPAKKKSQPVQKEKAAEEKNDDMATSASKEATNSAEASHKQEDVVKIGNDQSSAGGDQEDAKKNDGEESKNQPSSSSSLPPPPRRIIGGVDRPDSSKLTSGCGYGDSKKELVEKFWTKIWPAMEEAGWSLYDKDRSVRFFAPGIAEEDLYTSRKKRAKKGIHYFDRIRPVLNRLWERKFEEDFELADLMAAEDIDLDKVKDIPTATPGGLSPTDGRKRKRTGNSTLPVKGGKVDLSWKSGGAYFPKQTSRVGDEYQATALPEAGTFKVDDSSQVCELIWDPSRFEKDSDILKVLDKVKRGKDELLVHIHKNNYQTEGLDQIIANLKVEDGSDWSEQDIEAFNAAIFHYRKDFRKVASHINKSLKSCLAYYCAKYKKSDHYRVLKTVVVEESDDPLSSGIFGVDECAICGDGGSLIICDGCNAEYHMHCLRPSLAEVPEGEWECDECVDRRFLSTRDRFISESALFQAVAETEENGEVKDATNGIRTIEGELYEPTAKAKEIVQRLAVNLSRVLYET